MKKYAESLFQALILFGFAIYFVVLILSGTVYRYVHERHVPVMYAAAAVFVLIGCLKLKQAVQLYKNRRAAAQRNRYIGAADTANLLHGGKVFFSVAVFGVSLIGMTAVPSIGLRLSQFAFTDSLGGAYAAVPTEPSRVNASGAAVQHPNEQSLIGQDGSTQGAALQGKLAQKPAVQDIVMNEDTFSTWLSVLYTKLDSCIGAKVTISGSVWKDSSLFEPNEFAVARMMMVCCAADLQPVGLLAQWENTESLSDGEWVEITGTLSKKPYKDGFDPLIIVESAKKIDPPTREYIYQ